MRPLTVSGIERDHGRSAPERLARVAMIVSDPPSTMLRAAASMRRASGADVLEGVDQDHGVTAARGDPPPGLDGTLIDWPRVRRRPRPSSTTGSHPADLHVADLLGARPRARGSTRAPRARTQRARPGGEGLGCPRAARRRSRRASRGDGVATRSPSASGPRRRARSARSPSHTAGRRTSCPRRPRRPRGR